MRSRKTAMTYLHVLWKKKNMREWEAAALVASIACAQALKPEGAGCRLLLDEESRDALMGHKVDPEIWWDEVVLWDVEKTEFPYSKYADPWWALPKVLALSTLDPPFAIIDADLIPYRRVDPCAALVGLHGEPLENYQAWTYYFQALLPNLPVHVTPINMAVSCWADAELLNRYLHEAGSLVKHCALLSGPDGMTNNDLMKFLEQRLPVSVALSLGKNVFFLTETFDQNNPRLSNDRRTDPEVFHHLGEEKILLAASSEERLKFWRNTTRRLDNLLASVADERKPILALARTYFDSFNPHEA